MQLIAEKQIYMGRGEMIPPGSVFDVSDSRGRDMLRRGLARVDRNDYSKRKETAAYEVAAFVPQHTEPIVEAAPGPPFCDVPVLDAESAVVVAESHRELPETDVPKPRTAYRGRRRGSAGKRFSRR